MIAYAWPFVALVVGLTFASVLRIYLMMQIDTFEEIQEDLGEVEDKQRALQDAVGGVLARLDAVEPRLLEVENTNKILDARLPGNLSALRR